MGIDFRKHYPSTMPRGDVYEGDWVCSEDAEDWPCSFMSALLARAALADELAEALGPFARASARPLDLDDAPWITAHAALAKWEASHAE